MPPSEFAKAVEEVQRLLRGPLKAAGFKVRGRTFNRATSDGLTQVISLQMGASDPPGTIYIPGLRENLHGMFTVNLGVHIPEVAQVQDCAPKAWVQEYHCSIRTRLGQASGGQDIWWHASDPPRAVADIQPLLMSYGLIFLERFATRDHVLAELAAARDNLEYCAVPRIVSAVILRERGSTEMARQLLSAQAAECTRNPGHPAYVRELALRLGLGAV